MNTSTGSSTSGVDVSSIGSDNILNIPTIHQRGVLIVEPVCDSGSSSEDPDDPLNRYRTSSFKRAIERGLSGESSASASFDTNEPASTCSDLSPDRQEAPPFLKPEKNSKSHPRRKHKKKHIVENIQEPKQLYPERLYSVLPRPSKLKDPGFAGSSTELGDSFTVQSGDISHSHLDPSTSTHLDTTTSTSLTTTVDINRYTA